MASLPLLAFQHHVGSLLVDPGEIEYVSELGQGALGLVEKGRLHQPGGQITPVVVKSYKPGVVATPEDFRELLMEAGKLARLSHPRIPRFYGLGCYDHRTLAAVRSSLFSVEEFVGTRSLRRLLAEQMRSPSSLYDMTWALRWASQVAEALSFLHSRSPQYIHGDVTADNVFLEDHRHLEAAEVKLGDLKPHRHIYEKYVSLGSVAGPAAQPFPATTGPSVPPANGAPIEQYSLSRYSLQPHGSATASGTANGGGSGGSAPGPLSSRASGQPQGGPAAAAAAAAAAGGARGGGGGGGPSGMPTLHTIRSDPMAIGGGGGGGPSGRQRRGGGAAATALGTTAQSPAGSSYSDAVAADNSSGVLDPRGSTPLERFLITGVDDGAERGKKGGGMRWGPGVGAGAGRAAAGPLNTAAAIERGLMRMSTSLPGPSMLGSLLGDEEDEEAAAAAGEDEPGDGSSGGGARRRAARRSEAGRAARGDAAGGCPAPPVPIPGAARPPRLGVAGGGSALLGPLGSGGSNGTALSGSGGSGGGGGGGGGGTTSPPALSWDLSPSGAGVPSGSVQTALLDLFADVRAPQTEGPASLALSGGGAGPPPPPPPAAAPASRGGIASALAAPSAVTRGGSGGGSGQLAPSPFASHDAASGGAPAAPPLPPLPPGVAAARVGGGTSSSNSELSEFKTHGSCSAFAALTAIDAIAEDDCEGSSHGRARRGGAAAATLQPSGSASSGGLYSASGGSAHGGIGGSLSTVSTGGEEASRGSKRLQLPLSDRGAAGAVTSRDRGLLYTAPELLRGERPTEKVDVFSFGVLLYELLSRSLLLAWRLPQPARASPGAPPAVAAAAAAAAAAFGSYSPNSTPSGVGGGGGGVAAAAAATPTGAAATLAAAAAAAAAMADRSVSRSGRWAAAAATAQQQRNAGADAAQMLAYAARVAEGYRPPLPPFWPPAVADLVTRCYAQEPHERPRMTDVLRVLRGISEDQKAVARLNSYVNTDVGFMPPWLDPACPDAAAAAAAAEGSVKGSSAAGSRLARQRSGGSGGSSAAGGRSLRGSGAALSGLGATPPAKAAAADATAAAAPPQPEGACGCSIS